MTKHFWAKYWAKNFCEVSSIGVFYEIEFMFLFVFFLKLHLTWQVDSVIIMTPSIEVLNKCTALYIFKHNFANIKWNFSENLSVNRSILMRIPIWWGDIYRSRYSMLLLHARTDNYSIIMRYFLSNESYLFNKLIVFFLHKNTF